MATNEMQQATGLMEGGDPVSEEVVNRIFQYGLPTVILFAVGIGGWKILWALGHFLAPLISGLADAFKSFLSKLEVVGDGLLRQQEAQTELMKTQGNVLHTSAGQIAEIHSVVVKKP